jgi:hypothetical protein
MPNLEELMQLLQQQQESGPFVDQTPTNNPMPIQTSDSPNAPVPNYLTGINAPAPASPPVAPAVVPSAPIPRQPKSTPAAMNANSESDASSVAEKPDLKKYLMEKYGFGPGSDMDALTKAQMDKSKGENDALSQHGYATIAGALSGNADVKPDENFYKTLHNDAGKGVEDVLQRRAATTENLKNASQVDALSKEQQENDPNSDYSKSVQKSFLAVAKAAGMDPAVIENMSGSQLMAGIADPAKMMLGYKEAQMKAQEARDMKEMMLSNKQDTTQNQAMTEAAKAMEGLKARGSVKNAFEANRRAMNLISLVNQVKNKNDMTPGQVSTFKEEMSGMINGGAPTVQGATHVISPAASAKFADMMNYLDSGVRGAGMGKQIESYLPYFKDVINNSNKVIKNSQDQILSGYSRKARPEDLESLRTQFNKDLPDPEMLFNQGGSQKSQPATVIQNGHTYTLNPQTGKYE